MDFGKMADQVPALVLMVIVVSMFLKSMKTRDEAFTKFIDEQNNRFKDLAKACHGVQEKSTLAYFQNTKATSRLEKVLEDSTRALQQIRDQRN